MQAKPLATLRFRTAHCCMQLMQRLAKVCKQDKIDVRGMIHTHIRLIVRLKLLRIAARAPRGTASAARTQCTGPRI